MEEACYRERPMFGARGCYLDDRLVLVLCSRGQEPWEGLLVPTERHFHGSLLQDLPELHVHPVLGKWLYLREAQPEAFEGTALRLVDLIKEGDSRIGVKSPSRGQE